MKRNTMCHVSSFEVGGVSVCCGGTVQCSEVGTSIACCVP